MRLTELKPEWSPKHPNNPNANIDRYIDMQCPTCPRDADGDSSCGGMLLPVTLHRSDASAGWGWNGEEDFEKVTLTPSIWHHCKSDPHFFIRDGEIQFA